MNFIKGLVQTVVDVPIKVALAPINLAKDIVIGSNVFEAVLDALPPVIVVKSIAQKIGGGRVLIIDASDGRGPLGLSWDAGQALVAATGRFDFIIRATSWNHAAQELLAIGAHTRIKEVQFWGHGNDGAAFIGRDIFDQYTLNQPLWQQIIAQRNFAPDALWWWRTCSTCRGATGRQFAELFVNTLAIRMAGHTQYIGVTHCGLVLLRPGERAHWSDGSGAFCACLDMGHHLLGN